MRGELQRRNLSKWCGGLPSLLLPHAVCLGLRTLVLLLSWTVLRVNHFYGSCVGLILWWSNTNLKRIARINLRIAHPELTEDERDQMLRDSMLELGKTITELGPLWRGSERRIRGLVTGISGQHHVENALSAGKGVVALSPHIGAWELMGLYLSLEYGITSLYRPPKLKPAERFARQVRERFGAVLVPTDISGVGALRRALARNEMIGILPDQDPGESGGCYAPFLGQSARTMLLASRLAAKADCPVIISFAERLPKGAGYHIHFIPADPRIASADDATAAAALNEAVESVIALNPAQYQWSYKRFSSAPPGEVSPYADSLRRAA